MILALILLAHSWYPQECCDQRHCRPVPCSEIKSIGDYWAWWSFSWPKNEARTSPDGFCHVCVGDNVSYCLFLGGTS